LNLVFFDFLTIWNIFSVHIIRIIRLKLNIDFCRIPHFKIRILQHVFINVQSLKLLRICILTFLKWLHWILKFPRITHIYKIVWVFDWYIMTICLSQSFVVYPHVLVLKNQAVVLEFILIFETNLRFIFLYFIILRQKISAFKLLQRVLL